MKKRLISVSVFAAMSMATFANAQESPYIIYLGTFPVNGSEARINAITAKVQRGMSDNANYDAVESYVNGGRKVLYVRTKPVTRSEAFNVLNDVRNVSGVRDAFMKSKAVIDATGQSVQGTTQAVAPQTYAPAPKVAPQAVAVNEQVEVLTNDVQVDQTAVTTSSEPVETGVLTLRQAIQTALAENPSIKEAEYNYLQVGKDLKIAKSAYYPTLDAAASVGYEKRRYDESRTAPNKRGDGRVASTSLTLVENLYNGGADKNRINSQSHRLDSAAYAVAQRAEGISLQLANAYLELLHTKKVVDIETETVASHERIYSQIKERAQAGFGIASEERQAGSRLTLAQSNLIAAKNNYEDAVSTFEKLYGKKVDAERLVMPDFLVPLPSTENLITEKALLCNPSVLVQKSNIAMAESVVKEKNAPFLPKLDLEVSGRYDYSNVLYDNYEDRALDTMLRMRYNLYNKGIDKLDKEKSQLAVTQEQHSLDALIRELKESLKFSWQNYNLETKKMSYLNEHVEYAKATLDAYSDEFRIGRRDLINLLDAETEYNNAMKEIISTEIAIRYAQYRLLDAMGMLSDNFEPGFARRYIQGACSIETDLR
ncbi:MAG: TolC family outer membrane protein [Campylobacter sp.]|nr:TolC family outer membrane protein [Campylobacter sp.]